MAVEEPLTRVTLFVPGTARSVGAWDSALSRHGLRIDGGRLQGSKVESAVQVDWVEQDGQFGQAFSFGTVSPEVVAELEEAPGALVLDWPVDLREGRPQIVAVVERLRDVGAIAVRLEQSKVGWDAAQWVELFTSVSPWSWHRGAVALLSNEGTLQSCGMHAFSLPDVRIEGDGETESEVASALNVFQLAEDPLLLSGHTFSPDGDSPRRVVERWPDAEYPPDHSCHNPYGVWRLGPPGGEGRPIGRPLSVFVPALRVVLTALEAREGPLSKEQVEAARDQGACIALEPRDARVLERSRGYADLEPDLAWEQWKLVRKGGGSGGG